MSVEQERTLFTPFARAEFRRLGVAMFGLGLVRAMVFLLPSLFKVFSHK